MKRSSRKKKLADARGTMKRSLLTRFLSVCILLLAGLGLPVSFVSKALEGPEAASDAVKGDLPDCEIDGGPCSKRIGEKTVVFDVAPKPVKAMEELTLMVIVLPVHSPLHEGGQGQSEGITLDLMMPGMFMGKNQVILRKTADGIYAGRGVIPRCPSGKSLWKAVVAIPNLERVDFLFNVSR